MRWYVKCLIDNVKGVTPFHGTLRRIKRKACGYNASAGRADLAITEGLRMIRFIQPERPLRDAACLEIGAGWEPLLPMLFSLAGARKVVMTDLHRLCDERTFATAVAGLYRNRERIAQELGVARNFLETQLQWRPGTTTEEALRRFRIEYLAPCDCANLPLTDSSIDIIYSRDALEHIPKEVIRGIFTESRRVLAPDGLACHFIDCSDHWEHGDKSICRVNFLRYPEALFRLTYINGLNYQNRLRHPDYLNLLRACGFELVKEERLVDQPSLKALAHMPLAKPFTNIVIEDLATVDSFLLARPTSR